MDLSAEVRFEGTVGLEGFFQAAVQHGLDAGGHGPVCRPGLACGQPHLKSSMTSTELISCAADLMEPADGGVVVLGGKGGGHDFVQVGDLALEITDDVKGGAEIRDE